MPELIRQLRLLVSVILALTGLVAQANEYEPPGLYSESHYVLANGLQVILKPRYAVHSVSFRLQVNVGHYNFPCGKRETAHYLEHLLFTGTSTHSETQLDEIIESHGGYWNAETGNTYTRYDVDIFSQYAEVGLRTLYEIMTASTLTPENIATTRKIIYREAGGKPSEVRNWLYKENIIASAGKKAMNTLFPGHPGNEYVCNELDNIDGVTRQDILATYHRYYIPANMSLVVVGDFDAAAMQKLIDASFAKIPAAAAGMTAARPVYDPYIPNDSVFYGTLDPVLGSEATIYVVYRTEGKFSRDAAALDILGLYFQKEVYNALRVEKGMSYSPSADVSLSEHHGMFYFSTDSEIEDVATNLALIQRVVDKFKSGKLDATALFDNKQKFLLKLARGYESNARFANYYAAHSDEVPRYGRFRHYANSIERVSLDDIQRVTRKYFKPTNRVIAVRRPSLTYTQFYVVLGMLILSLVTLVIRRIMLHRRAPHRVK